MTEGIGTVVHPGAGPGIVEIENTTALGLVIGERTGTMTGEDTDREVESTGTETTVMNAIVIAGKPAPTTVDGVHIRQIANAVEAGHPTTGMRGGGIE